MKRLMCLVCVLLLLGILNLSGCTTANCDTAKKTLDSAQAVYDAALASGQHDELDKYRWAVEAADAVNEILCSRTME